MLAVAGEDVGGDGGDFERDEDDEQLDGAGEQAHADCAEDDERVVLALMMGVLGQSVEREQEGDENDAADEDVEEDGEGAGFDGASRSRCLRAGKAARGWPRGRSWFRWRRPSRAGGAAMRGGSDGVDEHDGDAGEREDDLGEDAVDVVNWSHRWTSASCDCRRSGSESRRLKPCASYGTTCARGLATIAGGVADGLPVVGWC